MYNSNRNPAGNDRFSIYGQHEDEVIELSKKLHLSVDDVLTAAQEVGFDSDAIDEYIRDRDNRAL